MNSLINLGFNVFCQSIFLSIIGFAALKIFARWSAPRRSLLASGILIAFVALPLLTYLFISMDIGWLKYKTAFPPAADNSLAFIYNANTVEQKTAQTAPAAKNTVKNTVAKAESSESGLSGKIFLPFLPKAIIAGECIWIAGMLFMLGKLVYGLIFLRGFHFGLLPVHDEKINRAMKSASVFFQAARLPGVYISPRVDSPVTIGLFNPVMILPANLYASLNENEIKSIVLHEFSHIYHYDHLMGLVKRIVLAANWWNPLVHIISAEHSSAREEVSDNYALSQLNPKVYSECLAGLAEKTCLISSLPVTVAMADKHVSLSRRIKNILSKGRNKEMKTGKPIKGIICALTCFSVMFIGGIQHLFADKPTGKNTTSQDILQISKHDIAQRSRLTSKGRSLSPEEVAQLEKKVSENPDNLSAITKLLGYYFPRRLKDDNIKKKRYHLILYLIEHYPEAAVLASLEVRLEECIPAVKLWKDQVAKHPKNLKILWNAACWLSWTDRGLCEKYLKQGQAAEPDNPAWSYKLGLFYLSPLHQQNLKALREFKKAYQKTTGDKTIILYLLLKAALDSGKYEEAEKYSLEMLEYSKRPNIAKHTQGRFIYYGNFGLGMVALKKGKTEEAAKYLLESGKTSGSPVLNSFGPNMMLAKELLEKGQKECVIKFLESCSKFWSMGRSRCNAWIKQIKSGAKPDFGPNLRY